jgi:hypothetical protein
LEEIFLSTDVSAVPALSEAPSIDRGTGWSRAPIEQFAGLLPGLVQRRDGMFFDMGVDRAASMTAVDAVFLSGACFAGIDYTTFIKVLYNTGPELARPPASRRLVYFADAIRPVDVARRELYKTVRIEQGEGAAEYYFEPVYIDAQEPPDGLLAQQAEAARLDFDEFVAGMWNKGIRFGIDAAAVRSMIASGKVGRLVVARRLEPMPGRDAEIVDAAQDLQRSGTPKVMADGRVDLMGFQNRYPQIKKDLRLLRKIPAAPGLPGYELSGATLPPAPSVDIDLAALAGAGTRIECQREGDILVAAQDGFLNVEGKTSRISITDKIVSRDGVSGRTTGSLQLSAAYEEFGEVQERRVVDGSDITIHGDVFGNINSRGGDIVLHSNLIGGSAFNAAGDIRVAGVASGAVMQSRSGTVTLVRAESCVISATRVVIGVASNCEIFADDVRIELAEGCAVAGRRIRIDSAGPRKQIEMLLFPLVPELAGFDRRIASFEGKAETLAALAARRQKEIDGIAALPDVGPYLALAKRVRRREILLTPEQQVQFQKMALVAGPALKAIGKLSASLKEIRDQEELLLEQVAQTRRQKRATAGQTSCVVENIAGDILMRTLTYNPDGAPAHDKTPKEIKTAIRGAAPSVAPVFAGASGRLDWTFELPFG